VIGNFKAQLAATGNTLDEFDLLIGCSALTLN
jgi:hypothetical protein